MHQQQFIKNFVNSIYIKQKQKKPQQQIHYQYHEFKQSQFQKNLLQKCNDTIKEISSYQVSSQDSIFFQKVQSEGSSLVCSLKPLYHTKLEECIQYLSQIKLEDYAEIIKQNFAIKQSLVAIQVQLKKFFLTQKQVEEFQTQIGSAWAGQNCIKHIHSEYQQETNKYEATKTKRNDQSNYLEKDNQCLIAQLNSLYRKINQFSEVQLKYRIELSQRQETIKRLLKDNSQLNEQIFDLSNRTLNIQYINKQEPNCKFNLNQKLVQVDLQIQQKIQETLNQYKQKERAKQLQNEKRNLENIQKLQRQYQYSFRKKQQQINTNIQKREEELLFIIRQIQQQKEIITQKQKRLRKTQQILDQRQANIAKRQQQLTIINNQAEKTNKIINYAVHPINKRKKQYYYSRVSDRNVHQPKSPQFFQHHSKMAYQNSEKKLQGLLNTNKFAKSANPSRSLLTNEKLENIEDKLSKLKNQLRKEIISFQY